MALPLPLPNITTLFGCTDFSLTVTPFISQLEPLPYRIFQSWNDVAALKDIYLTTNPLITAFAFSLFLVPVFLLLSEVNRNYSQVDRMWSILPTIYIAHYCVFAHLSGLNTERLDNLIAFSTVWSIRLTYNYWRRGGYSIGSEDYRWALLRSKVNAPVFFLFNVVFISFSQSILLFLITTPVYPMLLSTLVPSAETMSGADKIFVRGMMLLVLVEYFADQSQWSYQTAKAAYQKSAKAPLGYNAVDLDRGFVTTGLWAYSRHPNFAAEQAIWVALYQWACWDTTVLFNWTFAGPFGYLLLFQGSTWFTESITAGKYPDYKAYQKKVGKFLPKLADLVALFTLQDSEAEVAVKKEEEKKKVEAAPKKTAKKGGVTR